jgi:hypothetical protein
MTRVDGGEAGQSLQARWVIVLRRRRANNHDLLEIFCKILLYAYNSVLSHIWSMQHE